MTPLAGRGAHIARFVVSDHQWQDGLDRSCSIDNRWIVGGDRGNQHSTPRVTDDLVGHRPKKQETGGAKATVTDDDQRNVAIVSLAEHTRSCRTAGDNAVVFDPAFVETFPRRLEDPLRGACDRLFELRRQASIRSILVSGGIRRDVEQHDRTRRQLGKVGSEIDRYIRVTRPVYGYKDRSETLSTQGIAFPMCDDTCMTIDGNLSRSALDLDVNSTVSGDPP